MLNVLCKKDENNSGTITYSPNESFSKSTKGYNGVAAVATATICNHWRSVRILIGNETNTESSEDDGDTPLMEPMFFHNDDSPVLYSRPELITQESIVTKTLILHDIAIYGGLRTVEIIQATKLYGCNIKNLNRHGRIAFLIAQARGVRPEGFVEALQFMLDDIFAPKPKSLKQRGGIGNEHNLV